MGSMELSHIIIIYAIIAVAFFTLFMSRKKHYPEPIILLGLGFIGSFFLPSFYIYATYPLVLLCLILLLFDAGSRFIPRHFDRNIMVIGEFILISLLLNFFVSFMVLHLLVYQTISIGSIVISIIAGAILTACSQFELLNNLRVKHNLLYKVAEYENHLSNPITHIIMSIGIAYFIVAKYDQGYDLLSTLSGMVIIDVGLGIFIGLFMHFFYVKIMKRTHTWIIAIMFATAVFWIGIILGGTGYLAVIVMSLFFHNCLPKLPDLEEYTPAIKDFIYITVFLVIGFSLKLSLLSFLVGISLFSLYFVARYIFVEILFVKELHKLAFDFPKGLSVGAFLLVTMLVFNQEQVSIPQFDIIYSGLIVFFILSIIASYIFHITSRVIVDDVYYEPSIKK